MSYSEGTDSIAYNMEAKYQHINSGDCIPQKMGKLGLI